MQRACVLKLDMLHINGGVLLSACLYKQQRKVPQGSFSRPASQEQQLQKADNNFNLIILTAPKLLKGHSYRLQVVISHWLTSYKLISVTGPGLPTSSWVLDSSPTSSWVLVSSPTSSWVLISSPTSPWVLISSPTSLWVHTIFGHCIPIGVWVILGIS